MNISNISPLKRKRGEKAYRDGLQAEKRALLLLSHLGYHLLSHRLKTPFGEIDLIVSNEDWIVAVEVKYRKKTEDCYTALSEQQKNRLLKAFSFVLETNPQWQRSNTRYDVILVSENSKNIQHIKDAIRLM